MHRVPTSGIPSYSPLGIENLQNFVDAFVEVTEAFGQEVSIKKTEVMAINVQVPANPFSIFIRGKKLNVVHEFKYVGSTETETAKLDREVGIRIQRMAGAYSKLAKNVLNARHLKTRVKLRTYRTAVPPNGLYGCASWNTRKEHVDKMKAWQYRTLTTIMGYNWKDFILAAKMLSNVFC